jgi:uncharacterized membrane protein YkvA (DUF1232 family)
MGRAIVRLKQRAAELRLELSALYYAAGDPHVGFLPRFWIALALGYSLSPIDLIPDFIPVLGYLDDLIIVPFLISLAIRAIPKDVMGKCRERAAKEPVGLKKNPIAAILIVGLWLAILFLIGRAAIGAFRR